MSASEATTSGERLRIMFASAHPHLPELRGGLQANTDELAHSLLRRGHAVAVLSGLMGRKLLGLRARCALKLGAGVASDHAQGYRVYRHWRALDGVAAAVAAFRPDVIIAQSGGLVPLAKRAVELGVTTLAYLHNVEHDDQHGDPSSLTGVKFLANSQFTADAYARHFGLHAAVVHPIIPSELYRSTPRRRRYVTFINPHPHKGLETALAVAQACPDIVFLFVEAWRLEPQQRRELCRRLTVLPNVVLKPATANMRSIYGRSRFILMPSQWEETWGRVASEAHCSGLPVVATRCGGIPESVGPGGLLIARDAPISAWIEAVRSLWDDDQRYTALAEQATLYARRDALKPEHQTELVEAAIRQALGRGASSD